MCGWYSLFISTVECFVPAKTLLTAITALVVSDVLRSRLFKHFRVNMSFHPSAFWFRTGGKVVVFCSIMNEKNVFL